MGILALNLETPNQFILGEKFVFKRLTISIHYMTLKYLYKTILANSRQVD